MTIYGTKKWINAWQRNYQRTPEEQAAWRKRLFVRYGRMKRRRMAKWSISTPWVFK